MNLESDIEEILGTEISELLEGFRGITLEELDDCRLLSRFDRKFTFPINLIPRILSQLNDDYTVLEVEGRRLMKYETQYLDTPEYFMYMAHHNGIRNRYKIRIREYADTGLKFLEIKHKNNKGEVMKYRTPVTDHKIENPSRKSFIEYHSPFSASTLVPGVRTYFKRLTLVNFELLERITIDLGLRFRYNRQESGFPVVALAEIKSSERNLKSPFFSILRDLRIKEVSFSKYCTGTALLNEAVRTNIFKHQLNKFNRQQDEFIEYNRDGIISGNTVYQP